MNQFYLAGRNVMLFLAALSLVLSCSKESNTPTDPEVIPAKDSLKQILTFKADTIAGTINDSAHTISLAFPYLADLTHVKPVITVSSKATISPASGTEVNLTSPVTYTVKAENGSEQKYVVTATKVDDKGTYIMAFSVLGRIVPVIDSLFTGVIDEATHTITVKAPFFRITYKTGKTVIKLSEGATVSPSADAVVDFSTPVTYKVTSKTGAVQEYTVKVLNNERSLNFNFPFMSEIPGSGRWGMVGSLLTNSWYSTEVAGLQGDIGLFYALETEEVSNVAFAKVNLPVGASISPAADIPQNFNADIKYTVTAQSGDKTVYTVRVIKKKIVFPNEHSPDVSQTIDNNGNAGFSYACHSDLVKLWIVNREDNSKIYDCTVTESVKNSEGHVSGKFMIDAAAVPKGTYVLKVKLSTGEEVMTHAQYVYKMF